MRRFLNTYNWGAGNGKERGGYGGHSNKRRGDSNHVRTHEETLKLSNTERQLIYRRQSGLSVISHEPIYDYHHCPAIRDLREAGVVVRGGGVVIALGVSNVVHALLHEAEYVVSGDIRHRHDSTGILCRYSNDFDTEAAQELFDEFMGGIEFRRAVELVKIRRKQYGLAVFDD